MFVLILINNKKMSTRNSIVELFKTENNLTAFQIAQKSGLVMKTVSNEANTLVKDGKLQKRKEGIKTVFFVDVEEKKEPIEKKPVKKVIPVAKKEDGELRKFKDLSTPEKKAIKKAYLNGEGSYRQLEKEFRLNSKTGCMLMKIVKATYA